MTDSKTATERLCELLDERGVEWREYGYKNHAWWKGADGVGWHAKNRLSVNGLYVKIEAVLTIEQAIAATLGSGTCAQCAKDMGAYADSLCDPLKERVNELLRCLKNDWHIRASWDGLRKFWCIELTEEGVRIRDGGTCEMVASGTPCKGNTDKRCTACGAYGIGEHYDGDEHIATPKFCPECGKAVKR